MTAMDGVVLVIGSLEYGEKKIKAALEEVGNFSIVEITNKNLFSSMIGGISEMSLIILDLEFPTVKDGFDVLFKLRNNKTTSKTPIIITTKLDKPELRTSCLDYSVSDYIIKPYSLERLKKSVMSLITIKREFEYDFSGIVNITLSFEEYITKELKYSLRANHSFSMIVIRSVKIKPDSLVSNFAEIVNLNVPEKLKHALRSTDTVFLNTNGDMFILLPTTDADKAKMVNTKIDEILKEILGEKEASNNNQYLSSFVTFPDEGDSLQALLECAFKKIESKKTLEMMTSVLESARERAKIVYNRFKTN